MQLEAMALVPKGLMNISQGSTEIDDVNVFYEWNPCVYDIRQSEVLFAFLLLFFVFGLFAL